MLKSKIPNGLGRHSLLLGLLAVSALCCTLASGQDPESTTGSDPQAVWATVGATPITAQQVLSQLPTITDKRPLGDEQFQRLAAVALQKLIDRAVIHDYLISHQRGAGESQVQQELDALEAELATINRTLADHCQKLKLTEDQLREELAWKIAWQKYLDDLLTEANLERHFQRNRRRLDGSRIRVAHLWLRYVDGPVEPVIAKASKFADDLRAGTRDWATLVQQESQGSTERGGELGWIKIDGPMPPQFTTAAFALEVDQISRPVTTERGVHLIRCLEIEPGDPDWKASEERVRRDATLFLFRSLAEKHRGEVEILITAPAEVQPWLAGKSGDGDHLPQ